MPGFPAVFSAALFLFLCGCEAKPWQGKFKAPKDNTCFLLESVEIYGDNTADVKYEALKDIANFPTRFQEEDSILIIRELNRQWAFKWTGHDTLFEISNQDPFCFLVKEK